MSTEYLGTGLFALAVLHTLLAGRFRTLAKKYPNGSLPENFFHLLGEVEVVFGLWASILFISLIFLNGQAAAIEYVETRNYTEALFVFVIMAIAATRPILEAASRLLATVAKGLEKLLHLTRGEAELFCILFLGPIAGSGITEPAAMTVCALLLKEKFFRGSELSEKLKYALIGVLFVNVSIGGVLTHFAAPPVLMVAEPWGWNTPYLFTHFGWRAIGACFVNAAAVVFFFRQEIKRHVLPIAKKKKSPLALILCHFVFLLAVILTSHHSPVFLGVFFFFLGFFTATREYQSELKVKESLLVAYFLAGLVVLGGLQGWWLSPLLKSLGATPLFFSSIALTSFTDNAALTYLGTLVEGTEEFFRYALVAGAVVGGGLTVIANAPNPVGFSILQDQFKDGSIRAGTLFTAALLPTLVAIFWFWAL
jgi:hypothetical protein